MSRLFGISAASALLLVVSLPGAADAAQRADGLKSAGEYEVSTAKRTYVRRAYPRRYYGGGGYRPYPYYGYGPYWGPSPWPMTPGPWFWGW